MSIRQKVQKNSLLLSLGFLVGRLLAFLVFRRLTHLQGSEGAGVWGVAVELTAILVVVAGFGLDSLVTRETVKAPERGLKIFMAACRLRLLAAVFSYLALLVFVFVADYSAVVRTAVLIMALGMFFEVWAMTADAACQALEKVQYQALSQIASSLVYFVLAWIWLSQGHGVMGIVWANMVSRLLRLAVIWGLTVPLLRRHQAGGSDLPVTIAWLARMAWPLFVAGAIGILAFKIDTLMVMAYEGESGTGIYTAGRRLRDLMILVPHLFAVAVYPSLQRCRENDNSNLDNLNRTARKAMGWVQLAAVPLTVGGIVAAEPLVGLLIREQGFEDSVPVLRIVLLGLPVVAASYLANRLVLALGQEKHLVRVSGTALFVSLVANIGLLPLLGVRGAAMASVLTLTAAWLVYGVLLRRAGLQTGFVPGLLRAAALTLAAWMLSSALLQSVFPHWQISWTRVPAGNLVAFVGAGVTVALVYLALVFLYEKLLARRPVGES